MGCISMFCVKVPRSVYMLLFSSSCSCYALFTALSQAGSHVWALWHLMCTALENPKVAGLFHILVLPDITWLLSIIISETV